MGKKNKSNAAKKNKNNTKNQKTKSVISQKNFKGQNVQSNNAHAGAGSSNSKMANEEQHTAQNTNRYLGFTARGWAIVILVAIGFSIALFLIVPYIIAMVIAVQDKKVEDFINQINSFTILISIVGTLASIASIAMTLRDNKRFVDEKKHSNELFAEVNRLSRTLSQISDNIETLKKENEILSVEVIKLRNEVSVSKQIIERNFDAWRGSYEANEKD